MLNSSPLPVPIKLKREYKIEKKSIRDINYIEVLSTSRKHGLFFFQSMVQNIKD